MLSRVSLTTFEWENRLRYEECACIQRDYCTSSKLFAFVISESWFTINCVSDVHRKEYLIR